MSHFYLDASAVVKRYSPETGSAWIKTMTDPTAKHTIILGEITLAEVAAALAAKHRAPGGITQKERESVLALFLHHCDTEYDLIAISRSTIDGAVSLTQQHKLRGYDAVQLATALVANAALTAARRQQERVLARPATTAWPRLIPASLDGTCRWRRTRNPPASSRSMVRSSSRTF